MPKQFSHKVIYSRIPQTLEDRVKKIQETLGLTRCNVIRLCVERGIPVLEEQLAPKEPTKPQP